MEKIYLNIDEVVEIIKQQGLEHAVIHNPDNVFPPVEIFPLAEKLTYAAGKPLAVVMEMEGTILSARNISLLALESMVRQISSRVSKEEWHGLDRIIDYPSIVAIQAVKQVEFLLNRYSNFIKPESLKESFFFAALYILITIDDEYLKAEVKNAIKKAGCDKILTDDKLAEFISKKKFDKYNSHLITNYYLYNYGKDFHINNFQQMTAVGKIIYYQNYISILGKIRNNDTEEIEKEFLENPGQHLVEALEGAAIFIALVKGYIGDSIDELYDYFIENNRVKVLNANPHFDFLQGKSNLLKLSGIFKESPLRMALVSSSSSYETSLVLNQAFKYFRDQISEWNIPEEKKNKLLTDFNDPHNIFEIIITSNDSISIKFKPHRDNFRAALHQMNINKLDFNRVIGFATNESGVIATRAAGLGLCAAIPFGKMEGHDFSAASHVLRNGLPEAILLHNVFIKSGA